MNGAGKCKICQLARRLERGVCIDCRDRPGWHHHHFGQRLAHVFRELHRLHEMRPWLGLDRAKEAVAQASQELHAEMKESRP